jgi:hypothetical protein
MPPLTYERLTTSLNSLADKTHSDLPGATFTTHREQVLRAINAAHASIELALTRIEHALSAGQIKHRLGDKIDDILEDVVPATATQPAMLKTSKRKPKKLASTNAVIKKRSSKRTAAASLRPRVELATSFHTAAELECAAALLELARKVVIFTKV